MSISLQPFVLPKEFVILSEAKDLLSVEPGRAQVFPGRVLRFNQPNFLSPQPALNRFFADDGFVHLLERFIVNETVNFVIASESGIDIVLVVPSAAIDVVSDASVEYSRFAGQNVDVEMSHGTAGPLLRSG